MRHLFLLFAIFLYVNTCAQSKGDFKEMVKKSHQAFIDAILAEDYRLLSEILSDDVTLGTPGGGFGIKQDYISALKNGTLFYDSSANHFYNIRIYGTTGVVNGNVDLVFRYKDENNDWFRMLEHLTFTAVYVIDKKNIRMISWQSNRPTTDILEKVKGQIGAYEIFALKFAGSKGKEPASQIAVGGSAKDSIRGSSIIWLLKGDNGRMVLVDAGFTDTAQYPYPDYTRPDLVLQKINIKPEDITDLIVTHPHFDHIGGIDLFPNAMLWMQRDDFTYFIQSAWQKNGFAEGFDKKDVFKLIQKSVAGHLTLVKGDSIEIIPGIRVFVGSKHTYESQYVLVNGTSGNTIIASDNIWFYYNLDHLLPIPKYTFDSKAYVNSMMRMKTLVSNTELIIPGHDTLIFSKFPKVVDGVVKIEIEKK